MPYQMHPSGREKGEFFHFAFKNQILEDGKEIHPSFPFDALYAELKPRISGPRPFFTIHITNFFLLTD